MHLLLVQEPADCKLGKSEAKVAAGAKPIKQVGTATGELFSHMESCQPELCKQVRGRSKNSKVTIGEDGEEYVLYSFDELLPHHAMQKPLPFHSH